MIRENDMTAECCDTTEIHEDLLKIVRKCLPAERELAALSELFKAFGDPTRIRILFILSETEVCVCDLSEALGMTQSAVSHQLGALKRARLIRSRRSGKSVFYSLADEHVRTIIRQGMDHVLE